jgi:hypothetical protein
MVCFLFGGGADHQTSYNAYCNQCDAGFLPVMPDFPADPAYGTCGTFRNNNKT